MTAIIIPSNPKNTGINPSFQHFLIHNGHLVRFPCRNQNLWDDQSYPNYGKMSSYYLNIWHLNQMRKEQNSLTFEQHSSRQTSTICKSGLKPARTSLKMSRQIKKKGRKGIHKPKINTATTSHPSSSEDSHQKQQTIQPSQSTLAPSQKTTRFSSFELDDLIPQDKNQVSDQLSEIWTYLGDIGEYLLELQARYPRPHLNYSNYFGPTQRLRCITLINNYCQKMGLKLQTQFLAFDIFHRICTAPEFERYHSALKAAATLYIAAKYEEVLPPRASMFQGIDPLQEVAPENIIKLQSKILIHLNFNLSFALPVHFAELLVMRYQLEESSRNTLLQLCLRAMYREELWIGGGSLLAMACMSMVAGPVPTWQQGFLQAQLRWRVTLLQSLLQH